VDKVQEAKIAWEVKKLCPVRISQSIGGKLQTYQEEIMVKIIRIAIILKMLEMTIIEKYSIQIIIIEMNQNSWKKKTTGLIQNLRNLLDNISRTKLIARHPCSNLRMRNLSLFQPI